MLKDEKLKDSMKWKTGTSQSIKVGIIAILISIDPWNPREKHLWPIPQNEDRSNTIYYFVQQSWYDV